MALPINVTEDRIIYIVEISGGSPFRGKSWDLDDYNRQMEYKHSKKIRNEIGAIRQEINVIVNGTCMRFHKKIKFTSAAGKSTLERACTDADRRMKLIDPTLHITPVFFEQTVTQLSTGNMFELMKKQLNEQVNQRILDRIEQTLEDAKVKDKEGNVTSVKPITQRTRDALLKMIEGVKSINILDDETVNTRLDAIKEQMQTASFDDMRNELEDYIIDIQDEDDLEVNPSLPAKGMKADANLDEEEYQPRIMKPKTSAKPQTNINTEDTLPEIDIGEMV